MVPSRRCSCLLQQFLVVFVITMMIILLLLADQQSLVTPNLMNSLMSLQSHFFMSYICKAFFHLNISESTYLILQCLDSKILIVSLIG